MARLEDPATAGSDARRPTAGRRAERRAGGQRCQPQPARHRRPALAPAAAGGGGGPRPAEGEKPANRSWWLEDICGRKYQLLAAVDEAGGAAWSGAAPIVVAAQKGRTSVTSTSSRGAGIVGRCAVQFGPACVTAAAWRRSNVGRALAVFRRSLSVRRAI